MGRARYSKGYLILTAANEWQANWFPYVTDPQTGKEKRRHRTQIVGAKATMRRYEAEEELARLTRPLNANAGRAKVVTLGEFMDRRWKPMHQGHWRAESTKPATEHFMDVIRAKFGKTMLVELDKVALQEWLNELAETRSKSTVLHVNTLLKSICAQVVEEDFLAKNPALHIKPPALLRSTDTTVLTWEQLRQVFYALGERDRLIIAIEGTVGLRPSELFALRRRSFIGSQLHITETVYRGKIRDYGKTHGSMTTVDLSDSLARLLTDWLARQEKKSPESFIFQNADGGFLHKDNYLHRVLYPLREGQSAGITGIRKLNFQILRRTFSTLAQTHGTVKDVQRQMRHSKPDLTAAIYMQPIPESVRSMTSTMYEELMKLPGTVQ